MWVTRRYIDPVALRNVRPGARNRVVWGLALRAGRRREERRRGPPLVAAARVWEELALRCGRRAYPRLPASRNRGHSIGVIQSLSRPRMEQPGMFTF